MKVTIEFDSNNPEEMDAVLAVLSASPVGKDPVPDREAEAAAITAKKEADAAAKKAETAAKKAKADEEAAAKKAEADAKAKADADAKAEANVEVDDGLGPVDDAPALTLEDVRLALQGYAAIEGRPAAIAILNRHGAKSISELAPEKFRAAYDEAKLRK
jgi:hypothetical protein